MYGDSILSKYENDGNTVRNNGKDNNNDFMAQHTL
jgi:hypothetical protein